VRGGGKPKESKRHSKKNDIRGGKKHQWGEGLDIADEPEWGKKKCGGKKSSRREHTTVGKKGKERTKGGGEGRKGKREGRDASLFLEWVWDARGT